MNESVKRLRAENAAQQREIRELREGLRRLQGYLMSPKFHDDTTVQVADVLTRLRELL